MFACLYTIDLYMVSAHCMLLLFLFQVVKRFESPKALYKFPIVIIALLSRNRNIHQGPEQLVNLKPGKMYKFSSYIKQLNDMPGKMFQKYIANLALIWRDDGKKCQKGEDNFGSMYLTLSERLDDGRMCYTV